MRFYLQQQTLTCRAQKHPEAEKFKGKSFPLYDAIADLVDGALATGAHVFNPGLNAPAPGPAGAHAAQPVATDVDATESEDDEDEDEQVRDRSFA